MATAPPPTPETNLSDLVRAWDRRLRLTQLATWLPRSLVPGLALALVLGLLSRLRPLLDNEALALVAGIGLLAGLLAMIAAVVLWPRPTLEAARRFDRQFGLQERVSTALELAAGTIRAGESLAAAQLTDAQNRAAAINPREMLPVVVRWREWALVAALGVIVLALILAPNTVTTAAESEADADTRAAIEDAAADVRDIMSEVATDTSLDADTREALLEALQLDLETLEDPDVTEEEALATLRDAEARLAEAGFDQQSQAGQNQAALDAAGAALSDGEGDGESPQGSPQTGEGGESEAEGDPGEAGEGDSAVDPAEALEDLRARLGEMPPGEQQSTADSLDAAADALEATAPAAAQALREAAQALREGDMQAAQEALERAQQAVEQAQAQADAQQQSGESMQAGAESAAEAARELREAGQQGDGPTSEGQPLPPDAPPEGAPAGEAPQPPGQEGEGQGEGEQAAEGESESGEASQQGQAGEQPSAGANGEGLQDEETGIAGDDGAPGAQQPGQQGNEAAEGGAPTEGDASSGQQAGTDAGSGDTPGSAPGSGTDDTAGIPDADIEEGGPEGEATQGEFESVYTPRRVDAPDSGIDVELDPGEGDEPFEEGDFSENPDGEATVPYNEVFEDYADAANAALDREYVPLGMRDIVRDYFTSLAPSGDAGSEGGTGEASGE